MAYYEDKDEEQQDPNNPGAGAQTSQGSGLITGGEGGQSSNAPQAQATNAPDKPGNFVGITQYLNANKPQASKLGDQVSGVINSSADTARQGVSALNQEAQDKIKTVSPLDQSVSDKLKNGAESLTGDERSAVKNTEAAQYTGPQDSTSLQSYQNAADATNKATQNVNNAGSEQGRMNLITQVNSKPRTQGENIFDNALIQAGQGRDKVNSAATANQDVKTGLQSANDAINSQIGRADDPSTPDVDESAGAIGTTNKSRSDALKQVQEALSAWQNGFAPKVQQAQDSLVQKQNAISQDLSQNPYGLDADTMQALGLSAGQHVYGLNLNDYFSPVSATDINAANVATPEDYARYAALSDLAGPQDNPILDQANASQAGTAPTVKGKTADLQRDLTAAQGAYDQKYSNTHDAVGLDFAPDIRNDTEAHVKFRNAINQTPEQLETQTIPALMADPNGPGGRAAAALQRALDAWKQNQLYNQVITQNQG